MRARWLRSTTILGALAVLALTPAAAASQARDPLAPTGRWSAPARGGAKTPPMGWNSWNAFRTEVDEQKVMGAARALVDTGLAKLGYVYVNIDDGWWQNRRQSDGRMQIRTSIFPSAKTGGKAGTSFRPYVDRLHAMGLKAGIYTDVGRNACSQAYDLHSPNLPTGTAAEREVGLMGHVDQDIRLYFQEWGFDYVKVDACGLADFVPGTDLVTKNNYRGFDPVIVRGSLAQTDSGKVRALYESVADALARYNPDNDYVFSICAWGQANVREWGKEVGNLWRTSDDITPDWTRMLHTFDSAAQRALYAHPGAWNDPDMLFVGKGDFDENHLTEARSHFSLWAIINAPLLIGYDLRSAPKALLDIWGNADVVGINQDPAGNQAVLAYDTHDLQIFVKTLSDPSRKAVVIFNRGLEPIEANLTAEHLKFAPSAPVALKDLWTKQSHSFTGEKSFKLAPRETLTFTAQGERALANGVYLSEMPGSINMAEDGTVHPELDPTIHRMVDPWGGGTRGAGERPKYAGWGGARADSSPYGAALQSAGRKFVTGIGILAGSRFEVKNPGFQTFSAVVGVDDATRNPTSKVAFEVYGDGRLLARTEPLAFGAAPVELKANIAGSKIVELVARPDRKELSPASVMWGEAALTRP
jgi:hypothetical protein